MVPLPLTVPTTMFINLIKGGFLLHARAEARNMDASAATVVVKQPEIVWQMAGKRMEVSIAGIELGLQRRI